MEDEMDYLSNKIDYLERYIGYCIAKIEVGLKAKDIEEDIVKYTHEKTLLENILNHITTNEIT